MSAWSQIIVGGLEIYAHLLFSELKHFAYQARISERFARLIIVFKADTYWCFRTAFGRVVSFLTIRLCHYPSKFTY
jgi:hypothetical protein